MRRGHDLARLERAVEADPGAPEYAALAEAHRRAGRSREALAVARAGLERRPEHPEGLAVLCLALLDRGDADAARRELERAAAAGHAAFLGADAEPEAADEGGAIARGVTERELDQALARARTDRSEVLDADRVAQEAMRQAALDAPEAGALHPTDTYETETMAELLARQGDAAAASRIRAALGAAPGSEAEAAGEGLFPLEAPGRPRPVLATLERWLGNLRQLREAR